ncbi:hypothetical protein KME66_20420 [Streptomyces sp. YPW6]|uniref:hypothetical protein n=1 Tax=Streptomyces sp. YPW6 TaxID=2840373 RepID=UPI001C0B872C|nr:hypothetical protein [Streptomyces sp. YPW6]QWQ43078.1 hypothetical protein KME66_20420 [Streptomyces sp. YPW6]
MRARAYRPRWRYWAHRAGLLRSPSLLYTDVPFGTAGQRRRRRDRALARLARTESTGCTPGCTTCRVLADRARE